jgi:hypothetical protein
MLNRFANYIICKRPGITHVKGGEEVMACDVWQFRICLQPEPNERFNAFMVKKKMKTR